MTTQIEATLVDGVFRPDVKPDLADKTRVRLTVEPIGVESHPRGHAAFEAMKKLLEEEPLHFGGVKYSRDELYDCN